MISRLKSFETFVVDIPVSRPHVLSVATMRSQTMTLLRIEDLQGHVGWGEGTTIGGLSYGPEAPETIQLVLDRYIRPYILEFDLDDVEEIMGQLNNNIVGNHFAKCCVETALLDLKGRRHGCSVSTLLGKRTRDFLPVVWALASGDTTTDIKEAQSLIASRRHRDFKVKVGRRNPEDDLSHIRSLRDALPESCSIRVDANQAWTADIAGDICLAFAKAGVSMIEQPVAVDDYPSMAWLVNETDIAIMADEAVTGANSLRRIIAAGAADAVSIKIAQNGGLLAARQTASIAHGAGLSLYGGTMLEGPIGTAASAQAFATLPDPK